MPARKIAPVRLARVAHELAEGRSVAQISKRFADEWGVTERQIRTYCNRVIEAWGEDIENNRQVDHARIKLELWAALQLARATEDFGAAARILRVLAQVTGLYPGSIRR